MISLFSISVSSCTFSWIFSVSGWLCSSITSSILFSSKLSWASGWDWSTGSDSDSTFWGSANSLFDAVWAAVF